MLENSAGMILHGTEKLSPVCLMNGDAVGKKLGVYKSKLKGIHRVCDCVRTNRTWKREK